MALAYSVGYLPGYFRFYRDIDPNVFHRDITEAIASGQAANPPRPAHDSIQPLFPRYGDEVLRYFLMHDDHMSCQAAASDLRTARQNKH